ATCGQSTSDIDAATPVSHPEGCSLPSLPVATPDPLHYPGIYFAFYPTDRIWSELDPFRELPFLLQSIQMDHRIAHTREHVSLSKEASASGSGDPMRLVALHCSARVPLRAASEREEVSGHAKPLSR